MYIIQIWIEHPVRSLDRTFTYLSNTQIEQGCRVSVPFGKKNRVGFCESCQETTLSIQQLETQYQMQLKFVTEIIDEQPIITNELHDLALWMQETTLSTTISCFQAMLPSIIKPQGKMKKAVEENWVRLSSQEVNLTPKQLEAYQFLQDKKEILYSEFRKQYPNVVRALKEKGAIVIEPKKRQGQLQTSTSTSFKLPLTKEQAKAMQEIEESNDAIYLLNGVTGSGKTEIYLQLAEKQLNKGKQVLILVPEISLTPMMIQRVSARFKSALAIYHSGLNPQEKYEQYQLVKNKQARIVVGTRSSVFLPFDDLGLIIVDEEHDNSYKQDNQPCYHARDIAIYRGKYHHCKVILGSATPSLDSYARALRHVYHLVELPSRVNATKPKITIVPMRDAIQKGESCIISETLHKKMQEQLQQNKQIILLLNRRGYHTHLKCRSCQQVILCPHCDIAMSYHRDIKKLKCHTCGYEMYVPKICPSCGSQAGFTTFGFGTQKLEQEIQTLFPSAKTIRMDADTTTRKNAHEKLLKAFGNHEADILIGTQMIAKGLDYPDVTLVGIINGDEGLQRSDYRSCELTFDLLMQASGRSGRDKYPGEVVLQVFDANHYVMQCVINQDYKQFFQYEMQFRRAGQYPPYTYLIAITVTSMNQQKADAIALQIKNNLHGNFKVLGIISLLKIKDMCRDRIIMKGKNLDEMRHCLEQFLTTANIDTNTLRIDVNPFTLD